MPRPSLLSVLGAAGLWSASGKKSHFGFDCEYGYAHWEDAWNTEKKQWCCSYVQRGCAGDQRKAESFNCNNGVGNKWMDGWSDLKKDWCCENSRAWSDNNQLFCCDRDKGCHLDENGQSYNCQAHKGHQDKWHPNKKKWCCKWEPPLGCDLVVDKPYHCNAGVQATWKKEKKDWCCENEDKGCQRQEVDPHGMGEDVKRITVDPVDESDGFGAADACSAGYAERKYWPKDKICHCCRHYGIACPPVYYPPDIPDNAIICDTLRKYETGFGENALFSKVSPRLGKWAAGGALGLMLGAVALVAVRRGVKMAKRGGRYTSMPQKDTTSFLDAEASQEPEAPLDELS